VVIGKESIVQDLHLEVTSVQVDSTLDMADRFSFVINNGFDVSKREFIRVQGKTLPEFFELGSPVKVQMGYGDRKKLDLMLTGIVTELSTSFPSSGLPQVTVSGFDHSYCLTKGTDSNNWERQKDSDAVREIATDYKLEPKVEDTKVVLEKIERSQESAVQFVRKLAERNGFEFFVTEKELFFRKPANDKKAVIELEWGRGLLSFSPEIKLSEQVTQVEVYGWNIQTKEPIVGRARSGDEPGRDQSRSSGAEYLERVCKKKDATLRIREPVFSQQEADLRARAILKRRAEGFVGGRGESIGIPELKPNVNVSLKGLGAFFATTFYIQQTTHTVSSSGYRTTFEVKDVTI
jgi:Bacteriophage probable baseplate hub protein